MQANFMSAADIVYLPAAAATRAPAVKAVKIARPLGRRTMVFSGLAGLGLVGTAAAGFAATNLLPQTAPPAAPPAPSKAAAINPGPALAAPSDADRREWALFKAQVMSDDGRIVDNGNHGESHSEGQGVGMLFAVAFDDRAAFDQIHAWTKRHLLRSDGLHAWRYLPGSPNPVPDTNNATDGDIYIAAALQRAARRWNNPDHAVAAARTAQAIHDKLLAPIGSRLILMPAAFGFDHPDRVSVNLSYYIFPLLAELHGAYPSAQWEQLRSDGVALIQAARFGRWMLPPDWLDISKTGGAVTPASGFPARFSWDAVRVPLFLAWAGEAPDVVQAATAFWNHTPGHAPAWVDLQSGAVADYAVCPGVQAIGAIAAMSGSGGRRIAKVPTVAKDTYFSAALTLLSRMALMQMKADVSEA